MRNHTRVGALAAATLALAPIAPSAADSPFIGNWSGVWDITERLFHSGERVHCGQLGRLNPLLDGHRLAEAPRVQGHAVADRHMAREMQNRTCDVEGFHGAVGGAVVALPLGGGKRKRERLETRLERIVHAQHPEVPICSRYRISDRSPMMANVHERFMRNAMEEARRGAAEGNVAVGSVAVHGRPRAQPGRDAVRSHGACGDGGLAQREGRHGAHRLLGVHALHDLRALRFGPPAPPGRLAWSGH